MSEKERKAVLRIRDAYRIAQHMGNALVCAYSGGKDSDVLLDLTIKSGVKFVAEHNHTTADGYTADETLKTAQELYENKLVTYPRKDSRYITIDMQNTAAERQTNGNATF